jgi:hypothetical protein
MINTTNTTTKYNGGYRGLKKSLVNTTKAIENHVFFKNLPEIFQRKPDLADDNQDSTRMLPEPTNCQNTKTNTNDCCKTPEPLESLTNHLFIKALPKPTRVLPHWYNCSYGPSLNLPTRIKVRVR